MRVRRLINPLGMLWSILKPEWSKVYKNPQQPVALEIGTGQGNFFIEISKANPEINFIGVEIRKKLVDFVNEKIKSQKLNNAKVFYNASTGMINRVVFEEKPGGSE